jgi:hypothetical protein
VFPLVIGLPAVAWLELVQEAGVYRDVVAWRCFHGPAVRARPPG